MAPQLCAHMHSRTAYIIRTHRGLAQGICRCSERCGGPAPGVASAGGIRVGIVADGLKAFIPKNAYNIPQLVFVRFVAGSSALWRTSPVDSDEALAFRNSATNAGGT